MINFRNGGEVPRAEGKGSGCRESQRSESCGRCKKKRGKRGEAVFIPHLFVFIQYFSQAEEIKIKQEQEEKKTNGEEIGDKNDEEDKSGKSVKI